MAIDPGQEDPREGKQLVPLDVVQDSSGTVTSVETGAGLTGGPITATGTIALADIANSRLFANISGGVAPPSANTLSAVLDALVGSSQGSLLKRGASGWDALGPGTSGQFLETQGAGADPIWANAGAVTSVATGTGLTGGPITGSGTISLAAAADGTVLANIAGGSNAPVPVTTSALLDATLGSTQGQIAYRGAATWTTLNPGTSGQFLKTQGAGANPTWADTGAGAGTVTSVGTGTGLTGGPITGSGTVALASVADLHLLANISGGSAAPSANTLSATIDACVGSIQGNILYRNASSWVVLAPGTAGQVLTTGGAGANPSWATGGGSGATPMNDFSAGVPAVSNWTWQNQNGATATDSSPSGKAIFMQAGGNGASNDINMLYLTSLPSTPYTITALVLGTVDISGNGYGGFIGWSDGTKHQQLRFNVSNTGNGVAVTNFDNATTYNANVFAKVLQPTGYMWGQLTDDGTNVFFNVSVDGVNFVTVYTVAKASGFLGGSGYTRVGWGVNRQTSLGINPWATLRYWSTSTPAFP